MADDAVPSDPHLDDQPAPDAAPAHEAREQVAPVDVVPPDPHVDDQPVTDAGPVHEAPVEESLGALTSGVPPHEAPAEPAASAGPAGELPGLVATPDAATDPTVVLSAPVSGPASGAWAEPDLQPSADQPTTVAPLQGSAPPAAPAASPPPPPPVPSWGAVPGQLAPPAAPATQAAPHGPGMPGGYPNPGMPPTVPPTPGYAPPTADYAPTQAYGTPMGQPQPPAFGQPAGQTTAAGYPPPYPPTPGYPAPPAPAVGQAYPAPVGGQPWGAYPSSYVAPRRTDTTAVVGLILAVTSWIVCPIIAAVVALILASRSDRSINASGGQLEGHSLNTATRWIAWIHIVLTILLFVAGLAFLAWAGSTDPGWLDEITDPSTQF